MIRQLQVTTSKSLMTIYSSMHCVKDSIYEPQLRRSSPPGIVMYLDDLQR